SVSSGQVTFALDSLAGLGAFTDVSINLTAAGAGATASITASAMGTSEADPTNNTATVSSRIEPAPPSTPVATGVISTNSTLGNSLIPGGAGHFVSLNRPSASPSGEWWVVRGVAMIGTAQKVVLVRSSSEGDATLVAQQGLTPTSLGTVSNVD